MNKSDKTIKEVINKIKKVSKHNNSITYSEIEDIINKHFPYIEDNIDLIDKIFDQLSKYNIKIVNEDLTYTPTSNNNFVDNKVYTYNPLKMYLLEIGKVPLLTNQEEINLARHIYIGKQLKRILLIHKLKEKLKLITILSSFTYINKYIKKILKISINKDIEEISNELIKDLKKDKEEIKNKLDIKKLILRFQMLTNKLKQYKIYNISLKSLKRLNLFTYLYIKIKKLKKKSLKHIIIKINALNYILTNFNLSKDKNNKTKDMDLAYKILKNPYIKQDKFSPTNIKINQKVIKDKLLLINSLENELNYIKYCIEIFKLIKKQKDFEKLTKENKNKINLIISKSEQSKRKLTEANLRLVVSIAKKYSHRNIALLDIIQEGNLGLIKAIEKYDYRKGYKLSTYATWWIKQSINRALSDQSRTIRIPVHIVETLNRVTKVTRKLTQLLGREPTIEEIAEEVFPIDEYTIKKELIENESYTLDFNLFSEKIKLIKKQLKQLNMYINLFIDLSSNVIISKEQLNSIIKKRKKEAIEKVKEIIKISQEPISLESPIGNDNESGKVGDLISDEKATSPQELASHFLLRKEIEKVFNYLNERERAILEERYGFKDGQPKTLEEVGRSFGLTRERIRQIELKALRKLRNPKKTGHLRKFWGI